MKALILFVALAIATPAFAQPPATHPKAAIVTKRPYALTPTYDVRDSRGRTIQTIRQRPFALTPTWDVTNTKKKGK